MNADQTQALHGELDLSSQIRSLDLHTFATRRQPSHCDPMTCAAVWVVAELADMEADLSSISCFFALAVRLGCGGDDAWSLECANGPLQAWHLCVERLGSSHKSKRSHRELRGLPACLPGHSL
jgi:hypothetical protein